MRLRDRGVLVQARRLSQSLRDIHEGSWAQKVTLGKEGLFLTSVVYLDA